MRYLCYSKTHQKFENFVQKHREDNCIGIIGNEPARAEGFVITGNTAIVLLDFPPAEIYQALQRSNVSK